MDWPSTTFKLSGELDCMRDEGIQWREHRTPAKEKAQEPEDQLQEGSRRQE